MRFSLIFVVLTLLLGLAASPCSAQAARTWVSGVGDDANPCSRTAPCKTFAGAISKTAAGGEINTLDPGGFGTLTITKAITIRSDSIEAGVFASFTNGIVVVAGPNDRVVLEGLDIDGNAPASQSNNGINVLSGAAVYVLHCSIRNFVNPDGTNGNGVFVQSNTAGTRVFIRDSFIENNTGGVNVKGNGANNSVAIWNTLVDGNASFALKVGGAGNSAALISTVLSGSPAGIVNGGGTVNAFGPSNVVTGTGAPTTSTAFK